ncbi:NAD(P)H-hydrate dehydratase [Candidatus Sumerlaeota bacterium]|nr:NAD(P)H-hydrate dehydratase [Candidatus Sumerlaeota bacterium]
MRIVTAEEMRQIDRIAIEERGIPGLTLMERAGQAVANFILSRIYPRKVVVVTGKGNNAGDGFVAARLLHKAGVQVSLITLAPEDSLSGDALTNFRALPLGVNRMFCEKESQVYPWLSKADCIVDAILGTGVVGEVRGLYADIIKIIDHSPATVVSVDIPSGLPADAHYFDGLCVHADFTVNMGLPKLGMTQYPAAGYCGEVIVDSLGFPEDLLTAPTSSRCNLITAEMVKSFLPIRPPDGHKGTFGSVLIVAGSTGMTGAAALAAMSAASSGAGLVFAAIPQSLNPVLEVKLTEPLTLPLPTETDGVPDMSMYEEIMRKTEEIDCMALGPGMGKSPKTRELIRALYDNVRRPLVLDADGLNAFQDYSELFKDRDAPTILTPHPGELARLLKMKVSSLQKDRIETVRRFAMEHHVITVLKGAATVISDPEGEIFLNSSGNTALSKGGSGDVLTGLIAGFIAQEVEPIKASILGVFMHGLAGEYVSKEKTEWAALPSDLIEAFPLVFKELA